METFIRIRKEELNDNLVKKLLSLISGVKNPEITIRISNGSNSEYFDDLDASIKQFERGEVVSFTMEELKKYVKSAK
ncbi:MAG: hypothetical protein ABI723_17285 [Bacteroidia bacterium]